MGTTLTGTEIKDTYDSLIKVTDNGPISGTLKALSDGLGNDSTLSLSTTAASIAGTLAVTGNATFDTNTLFVDAAANEVGIGTITPNAVLNVIGEISQGDYSTATNSVFSQRSSNAIFLITTTGTTGSAGTGITYSWANGGQGPLTFSRAAGEVMRLDANGNVGIGTSAPATTLSVSKSSNSGSGSTFPRLSVLNTLATQGDGSSTFNFSDVQVSSGDGSVNMFLATTYAAGTWAPSGQLNVSTNHPLLFKTNNTERMRIDASGNVGIGTDAPNTKLDVNGTINVRNNGYEFGRITTNNVSGVDGGLTFQYITGGVFTNGLLLDAAGNVGIGTSAPATILEVAQVTPVVRLQASASDAFHGIEFRQGAGTDVEMKQLPQSGEFRISSGRAVAWGGFTSFYTDTVERVRITNNGLTFNGDTAAANALDDYEEGTFTPTIIGSTTAGTATYGGGQSGSYTKIGNFVHFTIYLGYSGGTGTGDLRISGLPFTISPSSLPSFTFGVFLAVALSANNFPIAGGIGSTNQIYINQIPTGGGSQTSVPYDDTAVIQVSGSYRV
jgi:hypothetical protein